MKLKEFYPINDHFVHETINPAIFWHAKNIIFKDIEQRVFDRAEIALLLNSSSNLKYCIENAKYYLNLSHSKNINEISRRKPSSFKDSDEYDDHIRAIGHKFLIPSIIVYNASFDYTRIFLFYLLIRRTEIIKFKGITRELIENEMKRLGLQRKSSWIYALNSLLTKPPLDKEIIKLFEFKLKKFLSSGFQKLFENQKRENTKLKNDYCANLIKHQQIPFFRPKSCANVGGAKYFPNLDQFYSVDTKYPQIIGGLPEIDLDINKTQMYLIRYHNNTVNVFNYLLDKIQII